MLDAQERVPVVMRRMSVVPRTIVAALFCLSGVLACGESSESRSDSAVDDASLATELLVYDNTLRNGFTSKTASTISRSTCSDERFSTSPCSYMAEFQPAGAIRFTRAGGFSLAGMTELEFALHPNGHWLGGFGVALQTTGGNFLPALQLDDGMVVTTLTNGFKRIRIPLSKLNPAGHSVQALELRNVSAWNLRRIWLDEVRLRGQTTEPAAPAAPTPPDAGTATAPDRATVPDVPFSTAAGRALPDTLYGVTTESVTNLSALVESVDRHQKAVTTRIVFQDGTSAASYDSAVNQLRSVGYVMGEILDSTALATISVSQYRARATSFVSRFTNKVDIWEIGNELNGEWLGTPSDINAKVQAAYDVVEKDFASLNLRSAITLNYWPSSNCYAYPWEATETFARNMPAEVRTGVDYVLLSFYETACSPRAYPTLSEVTTMFKTLSTIFPNAKLGFGEIGAQGAVDGLPADPTLAEKQRIASTYMGMHGGLKSSLGTRYVGGYFWWYYYQDAVPYDKAGSLWPNLEANFNAY